MTVSQRRPLIGYLVHDLGDAAVIRRVKMLRAGGADVVIIGFRRRDEPPAEIEGMPVVDLGQTGNGRFIQRAMAVLAALFRFGRIRRALRQADVLVARNLETLILAARGAAGRPVVYECLDIHRLLLSRSTPARAIQAIEHRLLRDVKLILTSSPRFITEYFARQPDLKARIALLENKVLALDGVYPVIEPPPPAPPWTIGWFGMLRCRRSLALLREISRSPGINVRILIAGRPSYDEIPDFDAQIAASSNVEYVGPYVAADLEQLYGSVHFAWAIDYFEEGLNSTWLLPNRLYEASAFGVVPIALRQVETGNWLARNGAGILVDDPLADIPALLADLTMSEYAHHRESVTHIPRASLYADLQECIALVDSIVT